MAGCFLRVRARGALDWGLLACLLVLGCLPASAEAATAPSGVWVVPGNGRNTITWEAGAGNTSHRVYRSTTSGTLGSLIATVAAPSTSWVDTGLTNGTSYYYTVRGFDGAESGDPAQAVTSTGVSFTTGRWWDDCSGVLNGKMYVFGGYRGGSNDTSEVFEYDASTNTQATSSYTLPTDRYWCGADRSAGKLYLFGGGAGTNGATLSNQILRFDPAAGFTTMNGTLPTNRYQVSAQTLADGTIAVLGGQNGSTLYPNTLRYDPALDPVGALADARSLTYPNGGIAVPGTAAVDGNLFLSGGNIDGSGTMLPGLRHKKVTVTFGPDTFTESDPGNLGSTRLGAGVAALNDRVYSIGGATYASEASRCGSFSCAVTGSILSFDVRSNTWSTLTATAPTSRMRRTAQRIKGFIYFVGGNDGSTFSPANFDATIYRLDPGGQARGTPGAPRFATEPTALSAAPRSGRALLSWTAGGTVDYYRVFRSTTSGDRGALIEEQAGGVDAPATTIADGGLTNGTTYYYTVTGVGYDGRETLPTAQVSVTPYATLAPTGLAQYESDGATAIASGAVTLNGISTNVVLRFSVSHPQAGRTLTPWVELSSTGVFTKACGETAAGVTFSGTPVSAPLASTSYSASVNVTGLAGSTSWYWRACSVDDIGVDGPWVARGGTPDFRTNGAGVATPTAPAADAWVGSGSPTLTARHDDAEGHTGRIRFEVCQSNAADPWSTTCGATWQRYDSAAGTVSGTTRSYVPTKPLAEGDSWWRVRSTDSTGSVGDWAVRRVRVDLTAPSVPTNLAMYARGGGRVDLTWTASLDTGAGGVTYDVEYSNNGSVFSTACAGTTLTTCQVTGLGNRMPAVMRVRACDAVGNCTIWQSRAGASAGIYYLRSTVNSGQLTNTANRAATAASGTSNTGTSITHGTGTGWFPVRPGVSGSTTNVGATEPTNVPRLNPTGTGWVVDATTGMALAAGDVGVDLVVNSSSATGAGDIQCRAFRVVASGGTISSYTFLGKGTVGVDVLSGTSSTPRSCTAATLASQVQLGANESIYVEVWLRVTTAGAGGANLALHVEGNQSNVFLPAPGVPPNIPTQNQPLNAATTTSTPTLQATYTHPAADSGFIEFEVATTNGFGSTTVQIATSSTLTPPQLGSAVIGPLGQAGTYHWRVRAVDASGLVSGWSTTWTFVTSSAPARPTNATPSDGGNSDSTTPALMSSAFSDPDAGATHQASQWQLVAEGVSFTTPLADSGVTTSNLVSWTTPALTLGDSYVWRVRHQDDAGMWSSWSVPTQFIATPSAAVTLSLDTNSLTLPVSSAGVDVFGSVTATVTTTNPTGYQLHTSGSAAGTLGADCGGCAVPFGDWTGTGDTPTPWTAGSSGYMGLTVRNATGGRMAKWGTGTGTAENDTVANKYAAMNTTAMLLHDRTTSTASDPVVLTIRANAAALTSVGSHVETLSIIAIANP